MSLNFDELEAPYQAFLRKLPPKECLITGGGCLKSEIISGYNPRQSTFFIPKLL